MNPGRLQRLIAFFFLISTPTLALGNVSEADAREIPILPQLLESRFEHWCDRSPAHQKGCEAAMNYLEAEASVRSLASEKSKEKFQRIREIMESENKTDRWVSGAINAWLLAIDPHARLALANLKTRTAQEDGIPVNGAGVKLRFSKGRVFVGYTYDGSGAEESGLLPGDEILRLNDNDVRRMSDPLKRKFFREASSPFRLLAKRGKRVFPLEVRAKRYRLPNVEWKLSSMSKKKKIGFLRLRSFDKGNTCEEVKAAVAALKMEGISRLELDLTNNPGGLVREAQCVAGLFLGKGMPFARLARVDDHEIRDFIPSTLSASSMAGQDEISLLTESELSFSLPLTVKINQNTASAAEMLAASLQDAKRSKLLGSRSFGKGTMQAVFHPWDDPGLHLTRTTHEIFRPSGKSLLFAGVIPDQILQKAEGTNFPREFDLVTQ